MAEKKPLVINDTTGDIEELKSGDTLPGIDSDLPGVCARKTTTQTAPTVFTDITFDTTPVENNAAIIEHDNTNTDRILIKETGLYLISYELEFTPTGAPSAISARVRINDTTVIFQSQTMIEEDQEETAVSTTFLVELTASDFVSLQYQCSVGTETLSAGAVINVARMRGSKGDTGATGSGSNIIVSEEGVNVANTPHSELDFFGMEATDQGSGVVKIENVFGSEFESFEKTVDQSTTGGSKANPVEYLKFTTASKSIGTFRIDWMYVWSHDDTGTDFEARVQVDDLTDLINPGASDGNEGYHIQEPKDSGGSGNGGTNQRHVSKGFVFVTFGSVGTHEIDIDFIGNGDTSTIHHGLVSIYRVS